MDYELTKFILANEAVKQPDKADLFYDALEALILHRHPVEHGFASIDINQSSVISTEEIVNFLEKTLSKRVEYHQEILNEIKRESEKGKNFSLKKIQDDLKDLQKILILAEDYFTLYAAFNSSPELKKRYTGEFNLKTFMSALEIKFEYCSAIYPSFVRNAIEAAEHATNMLRESRERFENAQAKTQTSGASIVKIRNDFFDKYDEARSVERCATWLINDFIISEEDKNQPRVEKDRTPLSEITSDLKEEIQKSDNLIQQKELEDDYAWYNY